MAHFDEPFLAIHWIEDGNIVCAEWKGSASGEDMRRGLDAGLELLAQEQSSCWLADTRFLGAVDPADSKWVNEHWIPRIVAAGARKMAFVVPKKAIAQIQTRSFMARIDDRELANQYFASLEEAQAWLRE